MNLHFQLKRRSAVLAMLAVMASASAQWTVTNLHPGGAAQSQVLGAQGGTHVGQVDFHARWFGGVLPDLNPTVVDLLGPVTAESSIANGVDGNQVVGAAVFNSVTKAGFWTLPGGAWTSLHPATAEFSMASAVSGSKQVGSAIDFDIDFAPRAYLWNGSPAGTDLNPPGSTASEALGISADEKVGYATLGGIEEASLWSGPSSTWTSLAPGVYSRAFGVQSPTIAHPAGRQVGYVFTDTFRASMWSGTPASIVDLHPAGPTEFSWATAIDQDHQVGWVTSGGSQHAALWKNTAASYVDLHAFLPGTFTDSVATAVYHTPTATIVVGSGSNAGIQQALTWTGPPLIAPIPWSGYLPPIKQNGSSIFKLKLPVPVWFRLTGDYANVTDLDARLYVARVTDGEVGTEFEPDQCGDEDEGNQFRYFCGYYVYVLGTRNLSKGTYRLRVDLGDGVDHSVLITLKK